MTVTQRKDVDFVWKEDIIALGDSPSTLIVFHQNEKGFAPFLAGMGLIGESEPVCHIYSKLFDVPAYNSAPEPTFPEWRLYQTFNDVGRRFFILRMTHVYPLPSVGGGDNTWIYSYPILRDIVLELNAFGVDELVYLTTNQMQSSIGYEPQNYAMLDPSDVVIYDYCLPEEDPMTTHGLVVEKDVVLPSPVWTFPSVFLDFCTNSIKGCWIALGYSDRNLFIDRDTAEELINYCAKTFGLTKASISRMDKLESLLLELEELTDIPTLDRIMNSEEFSSGGFFDEWV